jgi:hypothetical protein
MSSDSMSELPQSTSSNPTLEQLQQQIAQLQQIIVTLQTSQLPPSPHLNPSTTLPQPSPVSGIKVSPPDVFDGSINKTETFLSQLVLYFHGKKLKDDSDKIILALSYMKGGTAGPWAKIKVKQYSKEGSITSSWQEFESELLEAFGDPNPASTARHKLGQLKQGNHTADEYVASFRELKDDTGYNNAALIERFEQGLNSALVDKIYALPQMPTTLEGWIFWATKLDRQWRQREANKKSLTQSVKPVAPSRPTRPFQGPASATSPQQSEPIKQSGIAPMEVDSGWKSVRPLVCFQCRKPGHKAVDCKSRFNINSMDFDSLKAFMKEELQKEEGHRKQDFSSSHW